MTFREEGDPLRYLARLRKNAQARELEVWSYCLMPNHVHLIVVPRNREAMATTIRDAHSGYSLDFNRRHGFSGHLWQCRFYSCPLDDDHLAAAIRYVEWNPVRARLVGRPEEYRWSSAAARLGLRVDGLVGAGFPWRPQYAVPLGDEVEEESHWLRRHTRTGRPLGSAAFVARLENELDRPLAYKRTPRR